MENKTDKFLFVSQTADVVPFRYLGDELQILLIRRSEYAKAFPNCWAICGGFMDKTDRDIYDAAARELKEETGLAANKLYEIGAFTAKGRDPRGPVHSLAFASPFGYEESSLAKPGDDAKDAAWFGVRLGETVIDGHSSHSVATLFNSERHIVLKLVFTVSSGDYGVPRFETKVDCVAGGTSLAFDHAEILAQAFAKGSFLVSTPKGV